MTQIYRFNRSQPPVVNEKMLRAAIERQKVQQQIALLALAAILSELCLLTMAFILQPIHPLLSTVCITYAGLTIGGGGIIAIVFDKKRRTFTWQ